ncbi:MAG: hypothetical protein AAGC69_11855 [Paracraurococcus sp.]
MVKPAFARGAALVDPAGLFHAGPEGNTRRAIDPREDAQIDPAAFQGLIRAAVALTLAGKRPR